MYQRARKRNQKRRRSGVSKTDCVCAEFHSPVFSIHTVRSNGKITKQTKANASKDNMHNGSKKHNEGRLDAGGCGSLQGQEAE